MDDSPSLGFYVMDERKAPEAPNQAVSLSIQCAASGRTLVRVLTGPGKVKESGGFPFTRVRLRYDRNQPVRPTWFGIRDEILPSDPIEFARSLIGVDSLRIEYESVSEGTAIATFAVSGADSAVAAVAKMCNWES